MPCKARASGARSRRQRRDQGDLTVNGTAHEAEVEPRPLLVYFLRDQLGLKGTHVGCDTSSCGACTVLLDGESVKSCTVLAVQADGAEVTTIEGLGTTASSTRAAGVPRAARPAVRLLHARVRDGRGVAPSPRTRTRARTRSATGSRATSAAAPATTTSSAPSGRPPRARRMIPAAFDYVRAASVERGARAARGRRGREAPRRRALARAGDAAPPRAAVAARRHRPARRPSLRARRRRPIAIGALTRHAELIATRAARERLPVDRDGSRARRRPPGSASRDDRRLRRPCGSRLGLRHGAADARRRPRDPGAWRRADGADSGVLHGPFMTALGQQRLLTEIRVPP